MPERMAKTPAERADQGIHRLRPVHLQARRMGVRRQGGLCEERRLCAARRRQPQYFSGGKVVHFERVEWIVQPDPATASAALQTGEVDWLEFPVLDLLPMLRKSARVRGGALRSARLAGDHRVQSPVSAVRQSEAAARAAAGDRPEGLRHRLGGRAAGSGHLSGGLLHRQLADGERRRHGRRSPSPRDLAKAKKLVAESGYKGEKIVMMAPSDQPSIGRAVAGFARSLRQAGAERRLPGDGLGHAGGAAGQDGSAVAGWLERVPHHVGRARDVESWQFLSVARQRQAGLVRLADRRQDGGTARSVVRRVR